MSKFRFLPFVGVCALAAALSASAAVLEDINAHNAKGRTVFLVLTDASGVGVKSARSAAEAAQKRTPNSAVVELNRSDPAQRAAVSKYRVAAAPVPLVLVIASNGLGVGAARPAEKGAVDRLVALVPTPAKAEYLRVLSERRVAAVVFSRASMPEQSPLFKEITKTVRMPKLNMRTVLVNLDSPEEQSWIAQWKLDPKQIKRPLLIFVNPKGQVLGQLEGAPTAAQMAALSKKKITGCQDPKCKDPNCRHGK